MPSILEITNCGQHDQLIDGGGPVVIFFGSQYCGHCLTIKPHVVKLAAENPNVKFGHIEVTELQCNNISGVPAFVAYKDKQVAGTVVGADKSGLSNLVKKL